MSCEEYKHLMNQAYRCRSLATVTTDKQAAALLTEMAEEYSARAKRLSEEQKPAQCKPT